ncbi:hypothetical protein C9374_000709 [Naegleria lovaniensis]|uniref:F-box domain-containing protein n=1 Tax=Naegleria lovaniensis TaxID=51637 RepID=A0AA88GWZ3_NAELO|nr:uncharacterized protein C9374_000709 [Naegleria lovaniensis]KAG2388545.1 hypothetical protein C9374_000709 [Naegleria lovaniensis]
MPGFHNESSTRSSMLPFKPFSTKLLQEIKLTFTAQVWALIFSYLPHEDIYFGIGCVCRKWKAQFMDPLILSGILQTEPAADSSSMIITNENKKKNQSSTEWNQQPFLRKRQFIERFKLLIRNYMLSDLAQLLRYSSEHAAFEVLSGESENEEISLAMTTQSLKQRTLDIQNLDVLSSKVRSSLIKSVGDDRSNSDAFGGVTVKPVTTSTSFTLAIDETNGNEKTSLLHSYKKVRVSNFEIQEPAVNDLLKTRWNHYFSRFSWNHINPISHITDVHDDMAQSQTNSSGFGKIIQSIMNMFGCSMENDLALSAHSSLMQSSLDSSHQDKNFTTLKISLFINGEFANFIAEGYNEVGFDFMERSFKLGNMKYLCKLNLCGGGKRFLSGGLAQTKNSDFIILCCSNPEKDLEMYQEYFDTYGTNITCEYLMVHLKQPSTSTNTNALKKLAQYANHTLMSPCISLERQTFTSNIAILYCLFLHYCLKNHTFCKEKRH